MSVNPAPASSPTTRSYEDRVRAEMRHFSSSVAFDALPPAHHYWSNKYLRPEVTRVFEVAGIVQSYAHECAAAFAATGSRRLLSIGSGQGSNEVAIAKQLRALGFDEFRIDCLELVPELCEEGRRRAHEAGVAAHLRFIETDINTWAPAEDGYAFVVANQILHHVVELEHLFDGVRAALAPRGRFATRDMIGRNGHRCWPESKAVMDEVWPILPKRCTYDHRFERFLERYPDRDCSTEGFEGIRAQDILPLLLDRFHFAKFVAFGGLMERFVGRAFGLGYRVDEDEGDRALVDMIYLMNRRLIDTGVIKPTQMIATLALEPCATQCGFGWTPAFALRSSDA
jgi:SAM-dependent methyltransferase